MRAHIAIVVTALIAVVWLPATSAGQARVELTHNITESGFLIEPYSPIAHPALAPLFALSEWASVAPYAIVVRNSTDSPVQGIVFRYTGPDGRGGIAWASVQYNSYQSSSGAAAIDANSFTLVTPSGHLRQAQLDRVIRGEFNSVAKTGPRLLDSLNALSAVELSLDSLTLHDGRVVGSDNFKLIDWLAARRTAAEAILARLAKAGPGAAEMAEAVADLATGRPPDNADLAELMTRTFCADDSR